MKAYAACPAYESMETKMACRACSGEPARKKDLYQTIAPQDSFFMQLQQESLKKIEEIQKDNEFQEIMVELHGSASRASSAFREPPKNEQGNLYIFISFSMSEKAFLNIAHEAKQFGATLVLRGFKQGGYLKTAQSLMKIILKTGQGVIVDPELYTLFNITAVPTFVLAKPFSLQAQERIQTPLHDKLQGHVRTHYALETFEKEGDLQEEAQKFLHKGTTL